MGNFDAQLQRMKALYTYGSVNEDRKQSNSTLEFHRTAADGKEYGIIRECNHYYIKTTTPDKATVTESYNYIGGFSNRKDYQYDSYTNALKQFELKLGSINEAHDAKVDVTTLDPFKKGDLVIEGTEKMKNEIARQRQIMYNAGMIMNESKDYAVKGGSACSTAQPEAETGKKGDEGYTKTNADPEFAKKTKGLETKQEPFTKKVNEVASPNEGDFDEGAKPYGTTQNGEADTDHNNGPFTESPSVNEESEDWDSKGLPSSAGVGEADTDHNNDPFNNSVNEDAEGDDDVLLDDEDSDDENFDFEDGDEDFGAEADGDDVIDDDALMDDDAEFPEVADGEELAGEDFAGEGEGEDGDVMARIASLEAELAELKAQVGGEEAPVEDEVPADDDVPADDMGSEGEEDFGAEGEDDFGAEGVDDEDYDEVSEAKKHFMNQIIESVVKDFKKNLNEDELHDFGKHPGYRKKPMTLPATGEDKNEHGEDINDDSVHNEEPFGKQIGNGDPFNKIVDAVTKDVMYQLKKGVPIEGGDKKKAE